MIPILQTPKPPFDGSFRVTIDGKRSVVVVSKNVVTKAPARVDYLVGLTMDLMMQMVACKGGSIRWDR